MHALASVAFGVVSSIGPCVAVASVASHVVADSEPHVFKELAAHDLWTTKPMKVDPIQQHYERIPPRYSSYVIDMSSTTSKAAEDSPAPQRPASRPELSDEHLAWCAQRYRSFNPTTNTYRSYSGEIRQCSSPFQQIIAEADQHIGMQENDGAAAWCAARYQSYRREDNSYQPWEGLRRTCSPPDTLPGADRVATGK
ncbi:BA14K family protein [Rhizobium sp. P28RR-XV]|uniref:BA14K family protein n=1 Tax=Rhizobium sp. P28RR-XV TaxID=2726737 RepID=UPI001456C6B9|nr:BA14K family protein [Rhizobium sp. P28RR-XV]NLR86265.1 BA14K family protein [Rhizobium sp. P28RR-XV]